MTVEQLLPTKAITEAAKELDLRVPPLVAKLAKAAEKSRLTALEHARASRQTVSGEMCAVRAEADPDDLTGRFKTYEPK